MSVATISPRELAAFIDRGDVTEVIDVRTPAEFRETHVPQARNVPLDSVNRDVASKTTHPTYFICQGGGRSAKACQKLIDAGHTNVVSVDGGTKAWTDAGLPVVRGKRTISLERQVRIASGSLVLLGVVLAWFVHPYLIGISAFVGGGLVFAGVTDTCGMAMLLARMPWNRA
jgi:rhodanese-related sulfurtransferase